MDCAGKATWRRLFQPASQVGGLDAYPKAVSPERFRGCHRSPKAGGLREAACQTDYHDRLISFGLFRSLSCGRNALAVNAILCRSSRRFLCLFSAKMFLSPM